MQVGNIKFFFESNGNETVFEVDNLQHTKIENIKH